VKRLVKTETYFLFNIEELKIFFEYSGKCRKALFLVVETAADKKPYVNLDFDPVLCYNEVKDARLYADIKREACAN